MMTQNRWIAIGLMLGAFVASPATACPQQQQPQPPAIAPHTQPSPVPAQTFRGQVVRVTRGFALQTGSAALMLDDQGQSERYENRFVVVTGNVDPSGPVLHVETIQLAA